MPRGYELTSYYDALRATHRKMYSREIKKLSGLIKDFGYLNDNLYGLVISSLNNGLEDNLGELTRYMHHVSKADIGVNQKSRLQDFMSPLELRINSIAARRAVEAISKLGPRASVESMKRVCYEAGQSVGLEFQVLKIGGRKGEFLISIESPVLSTTPIIKKYEKALINGTYPKGEPLEYSGIKAKEKEDLIIANKRAFNEMKQQLIRLGLFDLGSIKTAFKSLNLGYYYIEDPRGSSLEMASLLFDKVDTSVLYYTELSMNLEKLTMAINILKTLNNASKNTIFETLYKTGLKARNQLVVTNRMLPEMFSGFYNVYAEAEMITAIKKQKFEEARKVKPESTKNL